MVVRIGHRGAAALAPENSLRSLELAVELGVDVVEFDVLRAGERLVLAHDPRVLRPEAPTLDEALDLLAGLEVGLHLDLKSPGEERRIVEALRRRELVARTYVSSVSLSVLAELRRLEPSLRRAISYPDDRFRLSRRRGFGPLAGPGTRALRQALPYRIGRWIHAVGASIASLNWRVASAAVAARCHALEVEIYAWTVNDPGTARGLVEAGLDGIITDDPRIFDGF